MRRFAIADIHGGLQTFLALIRKINPRHDDRVYLLGDYVDRGPDSKGVLDTIIGMQEAGCDIRPLMGNHDDMLLSSVTGDHDAFSRYWMEGWGTHTLKSFGICSPGHLPERYLNFLQSLPLSCRDGAYLLAHAGLDMTRNDPVSETRPEQMLWGDAVFSRAAGPCDGVKLVTGHKIRTLADIRESLSTSHIQLDNGACVGPSAEHGNLIALNLETLEIASQAWLDGGI